MQVVRFHCVVHLLVTPVLACVLALPQAAAAKTTLKFNMPERLDTFIVNTWARPVSALDPPNENASLLLENLTGVVYSQTVPAGALVADPSYSKFRYRAKPDEMTAMITQLALKQKVDGGSGVTRWRLKVKGQADLAQADPLRNTGYSEAELANMTLRLPLGDDTLFVNATGSALAAAGNCPKRACPHRPPRRRPVPCCPRRAPA